MSNIKIYTNETKNIISDTSERLNLELEKLYKNKTQILLLVSGGSALKILDSINAEILGSHITFGVLDERYSRDTKVNNFCQIMETGFYNNSINAGVKFIDTRINNNESQNSLAERFENRIKKWRSDNSKGVIVITQGIGPDGHTSGILPFPEEKDFFNKIFNDKNKSVVAYDATGKNQYTLRITTTLSFLRDVDISIVFVCGADKTEALRKTLSSDGDISTTPARIINEMKEVFLFTDIRL
ncbi:MAG: 6-phosphogluconolactonase [Candidatus Paceibacterota bacterium]|jgi:6-phosphogluconolactonase/glucosamine-6-phosphate isomerase/deaminase